MWPLHTLCCISKFIVFRGIIMETNNCYKCSKHCKHWRNILWVWLLLWSITESEQSHFGHFLLSAWTWNHAIVKYEQTDDSIYSVSNKFGSKEFRRSRMDNQNTHNLNSQSPCLWQKHSKPFEQHSSTWWCTTISKLDVKVSAVQKIWETQPLLKDLNFQPWPWG